MGPSPVDEIKNRLDIIEVLGSYIRLTKAGRNYKALCPFHSEKTPSFMVSPERQIWHCFGCNEGGDIFSFVKKIEGLEFGDALRLLANRAGVVLKKQDPAIQTKRKRLYEVCELATKFFETQLGKTNAGQKASEYLKERGLQAGTIKFWRLGWAPDDWHSLSQFLRSLGYTDEEATQAGLTVIREEKFQTPRLPAPEAQADGGQANSKIQTNSKPQISNYHDRFRSRIIFPIFDTQGQVVGFAGRLFGKEDENVGKYINTPQTVLYDKSSVIYGLNFAKIDIRQKNACIFVEGNMDVIASHQAGVKNAVASSGTALTENHLKIIRRYTENIIFAFDTDLAGRVATGRSIDLALEKEFNIKVVQIGSKDPADLIKQNPKNWQKAVENPISIMDYHFENVFAGQKTLRAEDKKQIGKTLLLQIKKIPNQIERAHWIGELAKRLKVDEKILYAELQKTKLSSPIVRNSPQEKSPQRDKTKTQDVEELLLSLFLNKPEQVKELSESPEKIFLTQELAIIFEELKNSLEESSDKEKCWQILRKRLPAELIAKTDYLYLASERFPIEEKLLGEEIQRCLDELKIIQIKSELMELNFEIREAQASKDKKRMEKSLVKFKDLSTKLVELTK